MGSGTILREVMAAADLLKADFGITADVWSATSFNELRRFFEVDRHYVTVAALKSLADDGTLPAAKVAEAVAKYDLDPSKPAPWTV